MKDAQKLLHAYIAGLVDGEGTITISYHKADEKRKIAVCYGVHVSVANTHLGMLLVVQDAFGGSIYSNSDKRGFRTCHKLYISRKTNKEFLLALLPYLVAKKEQAKLALKFLEAFPKRARGQKMPEDVLDDRHSYYIEMRKLNHTI